MLSCSRYATILAFDVKVERDSQEMADSLGVRVFSAEIIYHLFDAFTKYREDYKKAKQDEFKYVNTHYMIPTITLFCCHRP